MHLHLHLRSSTFAVPQSQSPSCHLLHLAHLSESRYRKCIRRRLETPHTALVVFHSLGSGCLDHIEHKLTKIHGLQGFHLAVHTTRCKLCLACFSIRFIASGVNWPALLHLDVPRSNDTCVKSEGIPGRCLSKGHHLLGFTCQKFGIVVGIVDLSVHNIRLASLPQPIRRSCALYLAYTSVLRIDTHPVIKTNL